MPVEFIGMIRTRDTSELDGPPATIGETAIDRGYLRDFARAHEEHGFDRVLIGHFSTAPDAWAIAGYAAAQTERLGFLIAHRPGFVAPTLAARHATTLDHLTGGRIALHVITGGNEAEQRADGDWLDKEARYRRTDEYLDLLTRVWTSEEPFDHAGEFYRVEGAFSDVKPLQRPHPPLSFGGASGPAVVVGAKHADVYALWGEPLAAVRERLAAVRAAAPPGRSPRFSLSLRLILAPTEAAAWDTARGYLERIVSLQGGAPDEAVMAQPGAVGSRRLLDFAAEKETHDKRLWTPIAAATGAAGNTTALVGTPDQVAESLLDYYDAGVSAFLIRGFRPMADAIEYGREVIPLVRAEVARRERAAEVAAPLPIGGAG